MTKNDKELVAVPFEVLLMSGERIKFYPTDTHKYYYVVGMSGELAIFCKELHKTFSVELRDNRIHVFANGSWTEVNALPEATPAETSVQ